MVETRDANEEIWRSDEGISHWVSTAAQRERSRAEHRAVLTELLPVADGEEFCFLDLGAGTGAASRAVLDRYPGARGVLADYSPQMIGQGRRELAGYEGRYRYVEADLTRAGWPPELDGAGDRPSVVISSLAVHHLPDQRKEELFGEILHHLPPGGWFLDYDPVAPPDAVVEEAWLRAGDRRDPEAAAKRANRSPEEQRRYDNHVRHIASLDLQLGYLRSAGFEGVDVYWKQLDHAIFGGRRPLV